MAVWSASSARCGVDGVEHEEDFAAHPVQFGVERAVTDPFGHRESFVQSGDRARRVARPRFSLGKRCLPQSVEDADVLLAQKFDAATHVIEPSFRRAAFGHRRAAEKDPGRSPKGQIVLTRESGEFIGVQCGARHVASHHREQGNARSPECARADMGEARDPRLSVADREKRRARSRPVATT